MINGWNDMRMMYTEGNLIESDYFANCNTMEYYERIVMKKRYFDFKNPPKQ